MTDNPDAAEPFSSFVVPARHVTCSENRVVYSVKLACHPVRICWPQKILTELALVRDDRQP
jgi:hypothetical protein